MIERMPVGAVIGGIAVMVCLFATIVVVVTSRTPKEKLDMLNEQIAFCRELGGEPHLTWANGGYVVGDCWLSK